MSAVITTPRPVVRREAPAPIPMSRLLDTELRKMFDTRAGFWLMASIGITAAVASIAVMLFAPDHLQNYETYATAVGFPVAVILPIVAVLAVTGEWSQRTGLTTFTLVPSRGRVITAKLLCILGVGVVSMLAAMAIGAVGNLLGSSLNGVEITWGITLLQFGLLVLSNVLGMLIGFMLGVLFRNSAAGIVGYFVYAFMLPTVFGLLYAFQEWFRDVHPWIDFQSATAVLYDGVPTGEQWAQLGVTGMAWLVIPTLVGLRMVMRGEVK